MKKPDIIHLSTAELVITSGYIFATQKRKLKTLAADKGVKESDVLRTALHYGLQYIETGKIK